MKEYTISECQQLFQTLFPNGFASSDIMEHVAPNGWENSPYVLPVPTVEQVYQGAKAEKALANLMARIESGNTANLENIEDFESFEDFKAHYQASMPNPAIELQETVGNCVWDIFSDNNEIIKDNKWYHIGSFRGSAGFIADWLNAISEKQYTYMNFYMGSFGKNDDEDGDLSPMYELIFTRLKQAGCDWIFHFTQMGLVDFSSAKNQEPDNPEDYDPNKALEKELKQKEEQKEKDDFRAKLDEMNAKEREDALYKPPPKVVQAYRAIFGRFPIGWPPV